MSRIGGLVIEYGGTLDIEDFIGMNNEGDEGDETQIH